MNPNSLNAFRNMSPEWKAKGKELVYLSLLDGPATREQIAKRIGLKKDTVNGRANDLLKQKLIEVIDVWPVESGNLADVLAIKER